MSDTCITIDKGENKKNDSSPNLFCYFHIEKSSVTFHFIKYIVDYIDEKSISS